MSDSKCMSRPGHLCSCFLWYCPDSCQDKIAALEKRCKELEESRDELAGKYYDAVWEAANYYKVIGELKAENAELRKRLEKEGE